MNKIIPFLWYDNQAEEAVNFYLSVFKKGRIISIERYGSEDSADKRESVLVVNFEIENQEFSAINGGPEFKFNPAVSFVINCKDQEEVDYFWEKLSEGGKSSQCGWLQDKYGLWWQVVPTILNDLLADKDRNKSNKVMKAMLKMEKIDIGLLKQAYEK